MEKLSNQIGSQRDTVSGYTGNVELTSGLIERAEWTVVRGLPELM